MRSNCMTLAMQGNEPPELALGYFPYSFDLRVALWRTPSLLPLSFVVEYHYFLKTSRIVKSWAVIRSFSSILFLSSTEADCLLIPYLILNFDSGITKKSDPYPLPPFMIEEWLISARSCWFPVIASLKSTLPLATLLLVLNIILDVTLSQSLSPITWLGLITFKLEPTSPPLEPPSWLKVWF